MKDRSQVCDLLIRYATVNDGRVVFHHSDHVSEWTSAEMVEKILTAFGPCFSCSRSLDGECIELVPVSAFTIAKLTGLIIVADLFYTTGAMVQL